ncbi:RING-H2 finger protein ATL2-like [Dioscorea cayenensis subsp. rotundata]|uniref:RING-type E3 ubiquitin transferase n=1 Tax=Dioscorea cayennensis subsp. rotundata TaxID=55577 RepID=A0AB40B6W0_DIOCR|nr:RING-H2 finger protein ATL2-like [Dioscorea cayenensis subsp. rotundata]
MASSPSNPPPLPPPNAFLPGTQEDNNNNYYYDYNNNYNYNNGYNLNNRIMLTAIISLCFVILLVIVLHLYARYVIRRHLANRRANLISTFRIGVASSSAFEMPETYSVGIDSSSIEKLPLFRYKRSGSENPTMECSVCLSALEDGEMVRMLPGCRHMFHVGCIDMWLHSHCTCPVCRAEVKAVMEKGETSSGSVLGLSSSFSKMLSWERSGRRVHDAPALSDDPERQ